MHISEGILNSPILATGAVLTVAGLAVGLKKIDYDELPQVAILSSVFFIATLIHIPLGLVPAHLILNGLCGILLGWAVFPVIFVGLTLQALLFQYGGLTTLGINTVIMAVPGIIVYYIFGSAVRSSQKKIRGIAEFCAGFFAILFSGILFSTVLLINGEAFNQLAKLVFMAHVPLAIVEGIVTIFLVEFLLKVKPDLLNLRQSNS
jgi:cobalt/nickel transport system permease protein